MRRALGLAVLAASLAVPAAGQGPGRFTFGGQLFAFVTYQPSSLPAAVPGAPCRCAYYGDGVTFTARLVKRLGLGVSVNFLPQHGAPVYRTGYGEVSVGPRLRLTSSRRWAFFLTLRPTWGWQLGSVYMTSPLPGGGATAVSYSFTNGFFGLDFGGLLQARITRHWLWRLSAGDLWAARSNMLLPGNNPQASMGIAYRF